MARAVRRAKSDGDDEQPRRRRPPARTMRARENQIISLAYDRVEARIERGEASAQEYTHFLKMGSSREKLEQARIAMETEVGRSKIEMMKSMEQRERLFKDAIRAMRSYQGAPPEDEEEDDGYEN